MAVVAKAPAYKQRTHSRLGQDASSDVVRKFAFLRESIHFGELVAGDGVDLFAEERRHGEQVMQVACPEQVILVPVKFVEAICAQAAGSAEKEQREGTRIAGAESGAALAADE